MNHLSSPEERLKALRTIRPDPVFLKWSKRAIFADARPIRRALPWHAHIAIGEMVARALRPLAAAGAMTAIALAAVTATSGAPAVAASLNGTAIAHERTSVAAETSTGQTRYFKGISPTISLALTDIIDTSTDYGSASHIKKGIALLANKN